MRLQLSVTFRQIYEYINHLRYLIMNHFIWFYEFPIIVQKRETHTKPV